MPKICIIQMLYSKKNPIPTPSCLIHNPHNTPHSPQFLILVLILSRTALHATGQVLWQDLTSHVVSTPNNAFSLEQPCDPVRSRPIGLPKKIHQHPLDKMCLSMWLFPLFIHLFVGWDALAKARRGKEKNRSKKRTLTGRHLGS